MGYKEELTAANRQGKTREERWKLRAAVREKYGMGEEKRKRGGVAGVYDRNKNTIVPIASGLAALTPLGIPAAMALGGAARGLDREGKSGIGFDFGKGLGGAVEGAAAGGLAKLASGGINAMRAGGLGGLKDSVASKLGMGTAPTTAPAGGGYNAAGSAVPKQSFASKALGFAKANPEAIGRGLTAGATFMDTANNRSMESQRLDFDKRRYEDERGDQKRRAEIAQKLYDMMLGQMSWNQPPRGPV